MEFVSVTPRRGYDRTRPRQKSLLYLVGWDSWVSYYLKKCKFKVQFVSLLSDVLL